MATTHGTWRRLDASAFIKQGKCQICSKKVYDRHKRHQSAKDDRRKSKIAATEGVMYGFTGSFAQTWSPIIPCYARHSWRLVSTGPPG